MKKNSTGIVHLYKSKTKHLLCAARVNGIQAQLLIDTGASNSCLNQALQEKFMLQIKGQPFEASGAGEGKLQAIHSTESKLNLGRYAAGTHAFVLLDMTHINTTLQSQGAKPIDGILGADFFFQRNVQIDYLNRKMIFSLKGTR